MHLLIVPWFVFHFSFPGEAAVVDQFADDPECAKYFYLKTEPVGLNRTSHARICQTYRSKDKDPALVYFATLYDRINRIPVYSAYILNITNGENTKKNINWQIEPQLVNNSFEATMERESDLKLKHANINEDIKRHQAVDSDYEKYVDSGYKNNLPTYDRGHLNPNGHHNTRGSRYATYTLTNIVPQTKLVNQQIWSDYENKLKSLPNNKKCKDLYVVTGAVPNATQWLMNGTEKRVNVPSHIWSAYCCVNNKGEPLENGGRLLKNDEFEKIYKISNPPSAEDKQNIINNELKSLSVPDLQDQLKTLLNANNQIMIFHGNCSHNKSPQARPELRRVKS